MRSDCNSAKTRQLGMYYSKIGFMQWLYWVDNLGKANMRKSVDFFFWGHIQIPHLHPGRTALLINITPNMHQQNFLHSQCFIINIKAHLWVDAVAQQPSKLNTQICAIWKVTYLPPRSQKRNKTAVWIVNGKLQSGFMIIRSFYFFSIMFLFMMDRKENLWLQIQMLFKFFLKKRSYLITQAKTHYCCPS